MRDGCLPPRDYFFSVLATLFPEEYSTLLDRVPQDRRDNLAAQKRYEMDGEIYRVLNNHEDHFGYLREKRAAITSTHKGDSEAGQIKITN